MTRRAVVWFVAVWAALTTVSSSYMLFLKAPSVVRVRPELAEVGAWDAAFSGRFASWLFYNEPAAGVAFTAIVMLLATTAMWVATRP